MRGWAWVVVPALLVGCSSDSDPELVTTTLSIPATSTSSTATSSSTTTTVPVQCDPASGAEVATVSAALTAGATRLGEAFSSTEGDLRWFAANVYEGDIRVSTADVWVFVGATPYALSGSAREYTLLPDGRDLPGSPSAGDEMAQALMECVTGG